MNGRQPTMHAIRVESARDRQRIVTRTHQQVEDFDIRRIGAAGAAHLSVCDTSGEVVAVAKRRLVKMQCARQVQSGQLRAGQRPLLVFQARIIEHVENINRLAFRRLRRDREDLGTQFRWQYHGVNERMHCAAQAAFDFQRPLDVR